MMGRRAVLAAIALMASVPLVLSAVLAALATRPKLAAKAFGGEPNPSRRPIDVGLDSVDVVYASGCQAWWIPVVDPVASVVIVHGFEPSEDPRATDPGPRLELAALLSEAGYNSLIISLGYGTGAHLHSGGALEADDIVAAVRWAQDKSDVAVAVFGFSAGGHASIAATAKISLLCVVTDSSFADFGEVVIQQGAEILSVPAQLFGSVRMFMKAATGHRPIDLHSWRIDKRTPMLHIHGRADEAIDFDNLGSLAAITGGETLAVPGADHIDSLNVVPQLYANTLLDFLRRSLSEFGDA